MDEESVRQRYFKLRKQLNDLNYSTNFSIDGVDVIEQLLGDLVSTTESYKLLHDKELRLEHELAVAQAQLFPLRKENAQLSKEISQLRSNIISMTQKHTRESTDNFVKIKKLEDQIVQLQHVCLKKDDELKSKEKEFNRLKEVTNTFLFFV